MLSKTVKDKKINNVFNIVKEEKLELKNKNILNIYNVAVSNANFDYEGLKKILINNLSNYVFSRKNIQNAIKDDEWELLFKNATRKFRDCSNEKDTGSGGELGELLLYLFLESELGAVKLLSKMELKTNTNMYSYGADGVFLYSHIIDDYTIYNLILGESKIQNKINEAINSAIASTKEHIEKKEIEVELVNSEIFKEVYTEEQVEEIKKIITPNPDNINKKISIDKAIGIFIGYSLEIDKTNLSNHEIIQKIKEKTEQDIKEIVKNFNKKIKEENLKAYSFYVYVLPFNNAMKDKKEIMQSILE